MDKNLPKLRLPLVVIFLWVSALGGCSSASKNADLPPPPEPSAPGHAQLPHPEGYQLADLEALLDTKDAPAPDTMKTCDADFRKLKEKSASTEELRLGTLELVRSDPAKYHWCFYLNIIELEKSVKKSFYIDEKQSSVLNAYSFLTPIARAFMAEFHDSRYLRWAVQHYRTLSEGVFYRKLELSREGTVELVEASQPFAFWRAPASRPASVLEKYGIRKPAPSPTPATTATPVPSLSGSPILVPEVTVSVTPFPTATPTSTPSPSPSPSPVTATAPLGARTPAGTVPTVIESELPVPEASPE